MSTRTFVTTLLCAVAVVGLSRSASSQPPGVEARGKAREARQEARAKARQARQEGREAARDARHEFREKLRERIQQMRETRRDRRRERRAKLREEWGEGVSQNPAMRAELRIHGWRMARLRRIRMVAEAEGKVELVARADALIAKEEARHQSRMAELKAQGTPPGQVQAPGQAAAPAAPAPSSGGAP